MEEELRAKLHSMRNFCNQNPNFDLYIAMKSLNFKENLKTSNKEYCDKFYSFLRKHYDKLIKYLEDHTKYDELTKTNYSLIRIFKVISQEVYEAEQYCFDTWCRLINGEIVTSEYSNLNGIKLEKSINNARSFLHVVQLFARDNIEILTLMNKLATDASNTDTLTFVFSNTYEVARVKQARTV